ncbi:MAG: hypothetical protein IKX69_03670 [Prevotella sp.]|nr:hypothetical protein [Prevotella sp.]
MKQKIAIFALMFALGTMCIDAQPKHRHHEVATAVKDSVAAVVKVDDAAAADEGIEAFSDTTSVAEDALDDSQAVTTTSTVSYDPTEYDSPFSWLETLLGGSLGVMGIIFAVLVVILVFAIILLVLFAPFIILILVLRYLVRQHNDHVTLAEKAMETGQPIPEELMPVDKQSDEYLRRRGIRNIWIGIGMVLMFGLWGADMLTGLGFLVLCYGIGQTMIARSSMKKNRQYDDINRKSSDIDSNKDQL